MTTDNRMTNQFTDEQIEAGAKSLAGISRDTSWEACDVWGDPNEWVEGYRAKARAALVAAAGVAPQAPSVRESDKECPHTPRDEWRRRGYCHRCTVESGWLAVDGTTSDGYHTFDELYRYRMLYNAHAARGWHSRGITVVKSYRHSDGKECFGGGWFIVTALLPSGQVSNHYEAEHWDLFDIPSVVMAPEYDGHTPEMAAARLKLDLRPDRNGRPGYTCTPFCNAESGAHARICPNFKEPKK